MDDEPHEFAAEDRARLNPEFQPARFVGDLRLPAADDQLLKDAAAAVRQEYRGLLELEAVAMAAAFALAGPMKVS